MESPSSPEPDLEPEHGSEAEHGLVSEQGGTVEFRPAPAGRWTLAALCGLGLAGAALSWLILAEGPAGPLLYGLGYSVVLFAPAVAVGLVVIDRRGVTRVGPDGVQNTRFGRTRRVAWHEMAGFEVRTTLAGRSVRVRLREGRPVTLAAPVQGKAARDEDFGERMGTLQTLAATYRHAPPDLNARSSWRPRSRTSLLALLAAGPLLLAVWSPWLGTG
ncbi:hypothetical protein [Actinomadura sp. 9N407]|uniref:hypothetical protein n=1 Tax=Actinomadura sp. 9N407 TaxID=3375154 RepID=UPI0037BD6BDF